VLRLKFQLVNLCANDVQRLYDALLYSGFLFSVIPVVGVTVYTAYLIGLWGLLGYAIFFSFIPLQVSLNRKSVLQRYYVHVSTQVARTKKCTFTS